MTRKKRSTWQPNEITSIIRSSQDHTKNMTSPSTSPNSSFGGASRSGLSQQDHNERPGSQSSIGGTDVHEDDATRPQSQNILQERIQGSQESLTRSQATPSSSMEERNQPSTQTVIPKKLRRTSSLVRLAMSLDGKASVIIRGQTPSPPNKTVFSDPLRRTSLQRSQSAVSSSTTVSAQEVAPLPLPSISRLPGRSRDTRNWEFWCDSERRESLTKSAEINLRGSAAGPLSLIRSSSSKTGGSIHKKRKSDEALNEQRPKLSRTKSSTGRLQSSQSDAKKLDLKNNSSTIYIDGSDSDKENVDPNASTMVAAPRQFAIPRVLGNVRQILRENTNVPSHSTSLGALLDKEKQNSPVKTLNKRGRKNVPVMDKENLEVEPEVANFMKPCSSQREEEDMDAVQNLLRLSKGAWQ